MAKRATFSYRTTALMALIGGAVALAAAIVQGVSDVTGFDLGTVWTVAGSVAIVAWFVGAASGILTLATEYKRWAIGGLAMCGLAIIAFLVAPLLMP